MLKYTLGALAAAVILIGAGGAILLQVTDGGADRGQATLIIVSAADTVVWPLDIEVERDQIIDLRFNNQSSQMRSLRLDDPSVEQLPEAPTHDGPPRPPGDGIYIAAAPRGGDSAYVRFKKSGEFTLNVVTSGVFFPPTPIRVIVK